MTDISGTWGGDLTVSGQSLPLVFHLASSPDGYTATMDSPAQHATGIAVDKVEFDGSTLKLTLGSLGATYVGTLAATGDRFNGTFTQHGTSFTLNLVPQQPGDASQVPAPAPRPQDPKPPYPYLSDDVTFTNTDAGVTLAGTITHPSGAGRFPAVILISGSGQQNRDEEIFNHRPFLVLSDALTRAGIVVLRYDDRGVGGSGGGSTLAAATSVTFADDAAYALAFLASQPYVDPAKIGVIGHSEGAIIADMLAAAEADAKRGVASESDVVLQAGGDPAFIVMLAGSGVPGDQLLMAQSEALLRAGDASENTITLVSDANREVYDILLSDTPRDEAEKQIAAVQRGLGMNADQIAGQRAQLFSPWFEYFLRYDPSTALRRIDVPVLALIGSLDRQVPADSNLPAIRSALAAAPTTDITVEELPGLNHLFQPAKTGSVDEYATIETTIDPSALEVVTTWITDRFASK